MDQRDHKPYTRKPNFNASDERSAEQRERELLRSAQAEGRDPPQDGARPLSAAHPDKERAAQGKAPAPEEAATGPGAGLPPGVSTADATDPGQRNQGNAPAKNRS